MALTRCCRGRDLIEWRGPTGELSFVPRSVVSHPRLSGNALERRNWPGQRERRPANPLLSLVVPVFNEEESIDLFLDTVVPLMERDGFRFEIVFVNDGSRDNTLAHLLDRARARPAPQDRQPVAQFRQGRQR